MSNISFEEFSEMLERCIFVSWRSVVCIKNSNLDSRINSILFTKKDGGEEWSFSFAVRVEDVWCQSSLSIPPVAYDPIDPPPFDDSESFSPASHMSPQNAASSISIQLLEDVRNKTRKAKVNV